MVGDIARALGSNILSHSDLFMQILLENLAVSLYLNAKLTFQQGKLSQAGWVGFTLIFIESEMFVLILCGAPDSKAFYFGNPCWETLKTLLL